MQVNATLLAAQEAARAARAQFQAAHFTPAPGFAAALEKEGFAPLPLKNLAAPQPSQAAPDAAPGARPGSQLDITV